MTEINEMDKIDNIIVATQYYLMAQKYKKEGKLEDAEKYYLMAIEKKDSRAMNDLGIFYHKQRELQLAEKYYLMAISYDKKYSNNLGILYAEENNFALAEKYYLIAIENNDHKALNNLGNLYKKQHKYNLAEKYYLESIQKECKSRTMHNLALIYKEQKKRDLAEKYLLESIQCDNDSLVTSDSAIDDLSRMYGNNYIKLYYKLSSLNNNNNNTLKEKLADLLKSKSVKNFHNKLKFLSKNGSCPICLDDNVITIPLECAHFYCCDCYSRQHKICALCDN